MISVLESNSDAVENLKFNTFFQTSTRLPLLRNQTWVDPKKDLSSQQNYNSRVDVFILNPYKPGAIGLNIFYNREVFISVKCSHQEFL